MTSLLFRPNFLKSVFDRSFDWLQIAHHREENEMKAVAKKQDWANFVKFYCEQNLGRLTRLGVFEPNNDVVTDYWIENGLPLTGIDFADTDGKPAIQIMFKGYSHEIKVPRSLTFRFTVAADEDGIDITDDDGRTTVLRFES